MARGKQKERALTPEEKLAQALVPVEEQPYPVPENWCWVYAPALLNIEYGKGLSSKQLLENGYPVFGANGQIGYFSEYMYETPQALMSCRGAYSGTMNMSKPKSYVTSNSLIIADKSKRMTPDFIFYLFSALDVTRLVTGSAQPQVTVQSFDNYPVPLLPVDEQHRIVARIESLFAKLDEAKEKAQMVLDSFETRKAAILHKAFSGELTARWRKENSGVAEWKTKKLSSVALLQTGLMKGKRFEGSTISMPYLRVANVQDGFLNLNEIKQIEVSETGYERYLLQKGDVLFTEGGDFDKLGRGTVWQGEIPNCLHQNHVFVVRVDRNVLVPEYLSYQAGSRYGKNYFLSCAKQTTNLASLNSTQLKNFPVRIAPIEEQKEIVRIISTSLQKEQKAKDIAIAAIDQIDAMKKSILAKAFRGELGTNDPSEESAVELLKKVLA